jgi:hypothetical protein
MRMKLTLTDKDRYVDIWILLFLTSDNEQKRQNFVRYLDQYHLLIRIRWISEQSDFRDCIYSWSICSKYHSKGYR